jgi:hypothetical protein
MNASFDVSEFDKVCEQLDTWYDQEDSPALRSALVRLEEFAEAGSMHAAEFLAEIQSHDGPLHDAAKAYKWYFITLSMQDYSTDFVDQNQTPPYYRGPVGDFRNESLVSDLVAELGFERILELDREAKTWISINRQFLA